jgi:hypothetical protein
LRLFHVFITGVSQVLENKLVFNVENLLLRWLGFYRSQLFINIKTVLYYVTHSVFAIMNFVRRSMRLDFNAVGSWGCTGTVLIKLELGDLLSVWIPKSKCHRNPFRSCSNETQRHHVILSTLSKKISTKRNMGVNWGGSKFPSNISPILPKLCQWRWKNNMRCYTFNTPNSFCFIGIKNV